MSVRIFGHFEHFSTFSARRAPCSATSCTPDTWTNGPYMTWVLCILVPMAHTPRGRSGATIVKVLAQNECGQFCHFGICGPNWDCHHAEWHGDDCKPSAWQSLLDLRWIAYGMANPISKPAWRYTIGSTPKFWLILSSQNDLLLGPQFQPPVWSIGGTISLCPQRARTKLQVLHSDMSPRSRLLSCEPLALPWQGEPRVRIMPVLVILASWPPLTNPWCPDAGTSEGTRLGEGSREFILEGHRVSCLVPTSDWSRRGVTFGVFGANISFG